MSRIREQVWEFLEDLCYEPGRNPQAEETGDLVEECTDDDFIMSLAPTFNEIADEIDAWKADKKDHA